MRIVADENIPGLDDTFGEYGSIFRLKGRDICDKDLTNADVLLVRSVTQVNQKLLRSSSVKFIGSATIGFDHLETSFLEDSGITWCHAPGCNADAAAQYTLAMILLAAKKITLDLPGITAGIVGLGNVGSRLRSLLLRVGVGNVLACDPPLELSGTRGLVSMEEIAQCNLISFHVPLTRTGPFPSWHLGDSAFFSRLQANTLLVNCSRGDVLDGKALSDWLGAGQTYAALDVWPDEPVIDLSLLNQVTLATPHVAGYTIEGKLNGTRMLFQQFLNWQGIATNTPLPPFPPPPLPLPESPAESWQEVVTGSCRVAEDDRNMRAAYKAAGQAPATVFDSLRKHYPVRRDFSGWLIPEKYPNELSNTLKNLGFIH